MGRACPCGGPRVPPPGPGREVCTAGKVAAAAGSAVQKSGRKAVLLTALHAWGFACEPVRLGYPWSAAPSIAAPFLYGGAEASYFIAYLGQKAPTTSRPSA